MVEINKNCDMKKNLFVLLTILSLLLFSEKIFAQTFKRRKDIANECIVIKYYDLDYQIILEKIIPFDSTQSPYFRLGLFIIKVNAPFDLFMMNSSIVVFDDGTTIKIKDNVDMFYTGANGRTQLSVSHRLDAKELELLCTKQISSFTINDYFKEFEKSDSSDIIKTIQKLKNEK